jgi:hypothetical protein
VVHCFLAPVDRLFRAAVFVAVVFLVVLRAAPPRLLRREPFMMLGETILANAFKTRVCLESQRPNFDFPAPPVRRLGGAPARINSIPRRTRS